MAGVDEVDLLAANIGQDRDPYARYHAERAQHSVAPTDHLGNRVYTVFSYEEAGIVLHDQERFSAAINGRMMRPLLGRTILEMDGREHFTHRRLIGHAFRPAVVKQWEETLIRPTAHELVDSFIDRGRADLVADFTWQLPVRVFAKILGLPAVDHARWQRWAVELETAPIDWQRAKRAAAEVHDYFEPMIAARRTEPADDLISDLVTSEIEGERLPDDVIHGFIRLLVPAGASTTYRLLGTMSLALLQRPEQLARVRDDRSLIAKAVQESLRWEAPVQFAAREALGDTELAGVAIPGGAPVIVGLGAANRDATEYAEPDSYDVHRDGRPPHVAFGDGVHRCLGEHLAKLEASVAFDVLIDRVPNIALDPNGSDPHVLGWAFRSPNTVPVSF
ncbi:MAG: cytochrome P450 [Actinomycetota bacterium]